MLVISYVCMRLFFHIVEERFYRIVKILPRTMIPFLFLVFISLNIKFFFFFKTLFQMHQKYESCLEKEFVKYFPFQNFCEILLKQFKIQCFIKRFKVDPWGIKFLRDKGYWTRFYFSFLSLFFFFLNIPQKCVPVFRTMLVPLWSRARL